jgi:hypothetical protein
MKHIDILWICLVTYFYTTILSILLDVRLLELQIGAIFELLLKSFVYWNSTVDFVLNVDVYIKKDKCFDTSLIPKFLYCTKWHYVRQICSRNICDIYLSRDYWAKYTKSPKLEKLLKLMTVKPDTKPHYLSPIYFLNKNSL